GAAAESAGGPTYQGRTAVTIQLADSKDGAEWLLRCPESPLRLVHAPDCPRPRNDPVPAMRDSPRNRRLPSWRGEPPPPRPGARPPRRGRGREGAMSAPARASTAESCCSRTRASGMNIFLACGQSGGHQRVCEVVTLAGAVWLPCFCLRRYGEPDRSPR